MRDTSVIGFFLIIANVIFSYNGFIKSQFMEDYKFEVDKILIEKDYKRLITSGFLHVSWTHLVFNMITLYAFSYPVESILGGIRFLIIYFISLLGGNLLTLYVHRQHGDYSGVGASGAVCGIIFASIAINPGIEIGMILIPLHIPGWIFGLLYVLYTIYGIKSDNDNVGHAAHLGGAMIGMLISLVMYPAVIVSNYVTILLITVPALIFIYFMITRPDFLLINKSMFNTPKKYYSIEDKYNEEKLKKQKEIDRILEKINKRGVNSLSKSEKESLDEYSRKSR